MNGFSENVDDSTIETAATHAEGATAENLSKVWKIANGWYKELYTELLWCNGRAMSSQPCETEFEPQGGRM